MKDLIERLEAATGPAHDLDGEIALALGWTYQKMKGDQRAYFRRPGETAYYNRSEPPRYTSSIDAALTLVPKGHWWTIEADAAWVRWLTANDVDTAQAHFNHRDGSSTALALCIAALKARCLVPSPDAESGR